MTRATPKCQARRVFLVAQKDDALPRRDFEALRAGLLDSPLVGPTTLNGPFASSRGFAVTFQEAGVPEVLARWPVLGPHFRALRGRPAVRALTPWFQRTEALPNAWYLNLLLVGEGGAVGRHVDATLRIPSGVDDLLPLVVSVLYLAVPPAERGGRLRILDRDEVLGVVEPREGRAVHFRGDVPHDVEPLVGLPEGRLRASLVLEQYHVPPEGLARLPVFELDSRAGFGALLDAHRAWGPRRRFDVDRP